MSTEEDVAVILADFRTEINESIATLTWAQFGLQKVVEVAEATATHPSNPDPRLIMGHGAPTSPDAKVLAEWRRSETILKLSPNGEAHSRLGRDWVVSLYQAWEDDIRPRIAKVLGVNKRRIVLPVMSDLRHIRHDIIHLRSVGSAEHTGKLTILKWFEVGDPIIIKGEHLLDFLGKMEHAEIQVLESESD